MTAPRFSICIPAYKAERYLAATLASVRAQTFPHWELIVVEDGSRDGTEEIVQAFGRQGPQEVFFFRHEKNQGLSATRNTGFAQAHTDVLALLDADDLWRPDHLQRSLAILEESGADVVFSGCQLFQSETGNLLGECVPAPGALREFPLSLHDGRIIIQPSAVVMKREVVARAGGFDPKFPICNDLEFWFRSAQKGSRFAYTGAITCDYRKHAAALSKNSAELVAELASIHRKYRLWSAIPTSQRRHELWRHHRNAAKMLFRKAPLRSLGLVWRGIPWSVG